MIIELRQPRISDAKRYLEILSHPDFLYFPAKPKTLKEEKNFLRQIRKFQDEGSQYNFAVTVDGTLAGGVGVKINPQFSYICEIGYFIERQLWNRGIATKSVQLLERFICEYLDIVRIQITTAKDNIASCEVANKSGYKKEGTMKKYMKVNNTYYDCCLFAKIIK